MSCLHSGLLHGSRRLLRILRSQQQGSPLYFLGQRSTAASQWQLRESELLREPVQVREFLMVAVSKERCTSSPSQLHFPKAAPEPLFAQTIRFSSAAAEVGVKEGTSGPSTDDSKSPAAAEEKVEAVHGVPEGDGDAAPRVAPKNAEVMSRDAVKIAELRDQLEEVEEELAKTQKCMKEMEDKMLRNVASAQNLVERSKREAESVRKYAVQGFAKDLLDVADNLSRAAAAVPKKLNDSENALSDEASKHLQALLLGVEMTEKQLLQAFKKHGLEKDDPVGQKFDPNFHSAVFEVEDESKEPGTVGVVLKAGYKLHDRVIRPANVGVVKAKPDPESPPES